MKMKMKIMSFFKKTFRSFLGLSNSDNNHTCRRRNIPPQAGGLTLISTSDHIQRPANVLESVAVKPTSTDGSGDHDFGETSSTGDDVVQSVTDAGTEFSGSIGFIDDAGDGGGRFELCTESLGFESLNERTNGGDPTVESTSPERSTTGKRSRKTMTTRTRREKMKPNGLPPLLSTLNKYGRPRFNLRPVRKDGRLKITKVRNDRPDIVRTRQRNGRLRVRLIKCGQDDEEELTSSEDDEDEEIEGGGDQRVTATNGDGSRRCQERSNVNLVQLMCHQCVMICKL